MKNVYAFDPGKATGWARLGSNFESGEAPLENVLHHVFETLKTGYQPDAIICEDFIYGPQTLRKTRQTWSTEGIGVLRFLAREFDVPFHLQSPASAKNFSTNEKLKRIDWYKPGQDHANDAARHLLLWAVENGRMDIRRFMNANG